MFGTSKSQLHGVTKLRVLKRAIPPSKIRRIEAISLDRRKVKRIQWTIGRTGGNRDAG